MRVSAPTRRMRGLFRALGLPLRSLASAAHRGLDGCEASHKGGARCLTIPEVDEGLTTTVNQSLQLANKNK